MNKEFFSTHNFNDTYGEILHVLTNHPEHKTKNRKGETIYELMNPTIILSHPENCYATIRNMSMPYLIGELIFYLKGENKVKNIEKYSKFWKTISDDGVNLNSCYGYYIYKMKIPGQSFNQLEYVVEQFKANKESKKAVMTIYSGERHSYKTKDNPCTMYIQFNIRNDKLNMVVNMRSNDVWFGLPYDVPYFVFLQHQVLYKVQETYPEVKLGVYHHRPGSLHLYERNLMAVEEILIKPHSDINVPGLTEETMKQLGHFIYWHDNMNSRKVTQRFIRDPFLLWAMDILKNVKWLDEAWKVSKKSKCLKKEVGGIYVKNDKVISEGWSGRPSAMGACKTCVRKTETFYQDGCNSIHSEYRAMLRHCRKGKSIKDFKGSTVYLTHGPCDQCMKLLVELGVKRCVFDVYYKTDFKKYAGFIEVFDKNGRELTAK
ncbi:MAG: hypothetical protein GWN64_07735 [Candidatus Thorarchaeota archaeon]|nr:hypothetical protein [Candidatus Thorarchaeota archaeon]